MWGSRVRLRRMMLSMSQEKLGEHLGITFQQIQKYEKGTNRIGASRLQHIATVLEVPVSFFFEDAPGSQQEASGMAESKSEEFRDRLPVFLRRVAAQSVIRSDQGSQGATQSRRPRSGFGR